MGGDGDGDGGTGFPSREDPDPTVHWPNSPYRRVGGSKIARRSGQEGGLKIRKKIKIKIKKQEGLA